MNKFKKYLTIYTDGSCRNNPGRGGFAAIVIDHNGIIVKTIIKAYKETTNNRMEVMPFISVLTWLQSIPPQIDRLSSYGSIQVFSDSQYAVKGVDWMKKWKQNNWYGKNGKKVLNIDLWAPLSLLIPTFNNLSFTQIKGHSTNAYNNMVDKLAQIASKSNKLIEDYGYLNYKALVNNKI